MGDGIAYTPAEYAILLEKLAPNIKSDNYSLGGAVKVLEEAMARELGKEHAVWFPTGTLANHLALRTLAGENRRVIVPAESHVYMDCGDCAQTLSNLNLIPLAPGKATFTLDQVEEVAKQGAGGRVPRNIGAILIESPVRRRTGEMFDVAEMKRITSWARQRGIGTHLDGARLYLASAYSGMSVAEYAAMFDTVYVSMYKYFNSPSGAILVGPKKLLENMFNARRMFGGGLPHAWPFTAVSMHYLQGFPDRFRHAVQTSETVIAALEKDSNFKVERIPNGSNIFRLRVFGVNSPNFQLRSEHNGFSLADANSEWFNVQVNETWNYRSATQILESLRKGLG